jgi:hypothetical protein
MRAMNEEFDAVIAMYHDQGLAPVRTLGRGRVVNLTLGLPFLQTSVEHGTAPDIAWKEWRAPQHGGAPHGRRLAGRVGPGRRLTPGPARPSPPAALVICRPRGPSRARQGSRLTAGARRLAAHHDHLLPRPQGVSRRQRASTTSA